MKLVEQQIMTASLKKPLFRIAPTPNGFLHRGNVYAFLITELNRNLHGGELLLRIDDLDLGRSKPIYFDDIFKVLDFLGIDWHWGPKDLSQATHEFSQAARMPLMRQEFWQLYQELASAFYVCDCSKSEVRARNKNGIYDGFCSGKNLEFKKGLCIRFRMNEVTPEIGDFVVLRRDGTLSYQWVSLLEDIRWNVNSIVRGKDLVPSTKAQLALARVLARSGQIDASSFLGAYFLHHPLLLDPQGEKYSKNRRDMSFLEEIRVSGVSRGEVFSNFIKWAFKAERSFQSNSRLDELFKVVADFDVFENHRFFIPRNGGADSTGGIQ